jgi:hypothetical protein
MVRRRTGVSRSVIGRLILAGIFLVASYAKLRPQIPDTPWSVAAVKTSLSFFAMEVNSFQLLSDSQVELRGAYAAVCGADSRAVAVERVAASLFGGAASVLLIGFFRAMVHTYRQGLEISCGCFGPGERLGPWSLARDGSMLAFALAVTVIVAFVALAPQRFYVR